MYVNSSQNCNLYEEGIVDLPEVIINKKLDELKPAPKKTVDFTIQCNLQQEIDANDKLEKQKRLFDSSVQTDNIVTPKTDTAIQTEELDVVPVKEEPSDSDKPKVEVPDNVKNKMSTTEEFMTLDLTDNKKPEDKNDIKINDGSSEFSLKNFMIEELNKGIDDWLLKYEELIFFKKIGGGSTCEVIRGEYRGLDCAIKKIS